MYRAVSFSPVVLLSIIANSLAAGDRLPTVRQLAVDLSVNPNTVSRAYTELELTGLVETQMGSGTFVGQQEVEGDEIERQRQLAPPVPGAAERLRPARTSTSGKAAS